MELIKSISGIRGIFNKSLTIQNSTIFSEKFVKQQKNGPILLARDTRPHGKQIYDNILKSLNRNRVESHVYFMEVVCTKLCK